MAKLGFIGTGTMGNPIAARLLAAGHELVVSTRRARPPRTSWSAARARRVAARGGAGVRGGVHARCRAPRRCARWPRAPTACSPRSEPGSCTSISRRARSRRCSRSCAAEAARGRDADRRAGLGRRARRRAGHARGDGERRARGLRRGPPAIRCVRGERLLPGRVRARHDREARQQPDLPRRRAARAGGLRARGEGRARRARAAADRERELGQALRGHGAAALRPQLRDDAVQARRSPRRTSRSRSRARASSARRCRSPRPPAQTYRRAVDEGRADQVFFATLATLERAAGVEVEKVG